MNDKAWTGCGGPGRRGGGGDWGLFKRTRMRTRSVVEL